jgi:pyruvate formate lyase activating enzyme
MESLRGGQYLSPEAAIDLAQRSGCEGIAWTYNEPGIWLEYTLDSAKLAKEQNLYTVYVTNGYLTGEALDAIGPYLDAFRVDFKGFSDQLYRDLAKVHRWRGILDITKRAQDKWDMHVEVITNVIPTINDDEKQLTAIATWIRDNLGELTPWHITRFHPHYQMQHLPPTPVESLEQAYQIGRRAGLHFVYTGNVPGNERENTRCYACGAEAVRRFGYETHLIGLTDGACSTCGADLNFKTPSWQRSFAEKTRGR